MSIVKNTPEVLQSLQHEMSGLRARLEKAQAFSKLKNDWEPVREQMRLNLDSVENSLDQFTEIPSDKFIVHITTLLERRRQVRFFMELPELSEAQIAPTADKIAKLSVEIKKYKEGLDKVK